MTTSPYGKYESRRAQARVDASALAETADVLRQLAAHDKHVDIRRGDVSTALAALTETLSLSFDELPRDVVRAAKAVTAAVDRATRR